MIVYIVRIFWTLFILSLLIIIINSIYTIGTDIDNYLNKQEYINNKDYDISDDIDNLFIDVKKLYLYYCYWLDSKYERNRLLKIGLYDYNNTTHYNIIGREIHNDSLRNLEFSFENIDIITSNSNYNKIIFSEHSICCGDASSGI